MRNETNAGAAPAVTDIGLPELRDLLKASAISGESINLSHLAAGALYRATTTRSPESDTMSDCTKCKGIGAAYKIGRNHGRATATATPQPAGYLKQADLVKLGNCRAELWAKLDDVDAVPVYFGAPPAPADQARIGKLEAEVADWMKCARDNQEMLNTIGRQLGGRIPEQLVSEVARQCVNRIAELEAAIDKLAACKGRFHTEASFKALIAVRGKVLP
jgi:hypothetical protein